MNDEHGIEFKAIHQMQYVELINKLTSIAQRLNEIESIIGGTKRKWRDEVDLRLTKLEQHAQRHAEKEELCPHGLKEHYGCDRKPIQTSGDMTATPDIKDGDRFPQGCTCGQYGLNKAGFLTCPIHTTKTPVSKECKHLNVNKNEYKCLRE